MRNFKKVEYEAYNGRRYGRPWAAQLILNGLETDYRFIQDAFAGNQNGGTLLFETIPGCAYTYGQKDFNDKRNEIAYFGIDRAGKELLFASEGAAREFLLSQKINNR